MRGGGGISGGTASGAEGAQVVRLLARPLGGSRLVRDYLAGVGAAAGFYRGGAFDLDSYRMRAEELNRANGSDILATAAAIIRPAGPDARSALDEVIRDGGCFVTTGQQPGLFGGPLYSLYKALTAARLAEELTEALGRPVMPLFWVASDDHDWEEANHTHILDGSNQLLRLTLGDGTPEARRPLGRTCLGSDVAEVVEELAGRFPPNDFHARYMDLLRDTFTPTATMGSAFSTFMAELLRDTRVGLVDAGDPRLKEASRPIFRAELEDPAGAEAVLRETGEALTAGGYDLQVSLLRGAANLFVDSQAGRERLQRATGGFRLKRSDRHLSRQRIMRLVEESPHAISPNVLLRPVVESSIFPTLAYVGGPGELAYFGQLAGLFRFHGVGMPIVTPRASLLVVEGKVAKVLDKFGITVDDVREGDALVSRFARERLPGEVSGPIARWRATVESLAQELGDACADLDPGLRGTVVKTRNAGLDALGTLEKKMVRAVRRRNQTTWSQIEKARINLWPDGKPQDRVLSPMQYLLRYGDGFVSMARREIQVELRRA